MNIDNWVPEIYEGITWKEGHLFDQDLQMKIPLNQSANMIIENMDGIKTCGDLFEETKDLYRVDEETYYKDFKKLVIFLNKKGIIRLRYTNYYRFIEWFINYIYQYLGLNQRINYDTSNFLGIFTLFFMIVSRQIFIFWFLSLVFGAYLFILYQLPILIKIYTLYSVAFLGLISSFALHEATHVYLYRKVKNPVAKGYISVNVFSIKFVRPTIKNNKKKAIMVPLFGSLIPGLIGLIYFLFYFSFKLSHPYIIYSTFFFAPYCVHLLYLLPFGGDGKSTFKSLFLKNERTFL